MLLITTIYLLTDIIAFGVPCRNLILHAPAPFVAGRSPLVSAHLRRLLPIAATVDLLPAAISCSVCYDSLMLVKPLPLLVIAYSFHLFSLAAAG